MLSPEATTAMDFYAEVLEKLGLDPTSIDKQWDRVDCFLASPPSGMETEPEKHFIQVVDEAMAGLPEETES